MTHDFTESFRTYGEMRGVNQWVKREGENGRGGREPEGEGEKGRREGEGREKRERGEKGRRGREKKGRGQREGRNGGKGRGEERRWGQVHLWHSGDDIWILGGIILRVSAVHSSLPTLHHVHLSSLSIILPLTGKVSTLKPTDTDTASQIPKSPFQTTLPWTL
jgi:hypothetical protein